MEPFLFVHQHHHQQQVEVHSATRRSATSWREEGGRAWSAAASGVIAEMSAVGEWRRKDSSPVISICRQINIVNIDDPLIGFICFINHCIVSPGGTTGRDVGQTGLYLGRPGWENTAVHMFATATQPGQTVRGLVGGRKDRRGIHDWTCVQ